MFSDVYFNIKSILSPEGWQGFLWELWEPRVCFQWACLSVRGFLFIQTMLIQQVVLENIAVAYLEVTFATEHKL